MDSNDCNHDSKSMSLAKEIVSTIEQVFTSPPHLQDRILAMMLQNSSDGYLFLSILSNMVPALAGIPVEYIEHCLQRTENSLELSADKSKVRLRRSIPLSTVPSDRFGNTNRSDNNEISSTLPEREETGEYYVEYTPRFWHPANTGESPAGKSEDLEDERPRPNLTPVVYHHGSFVVDNQIGENTSNLSQELVPKYTRETEKPIGEVEEQIHVNRCFNCNSLEHSFKQCPEPRNVPLIRTNRKHYLQNESSTGINSTRFFVELGLRDAVSVLLPGRLSHHLQEALNMQSGEPPYYPKMREHGYPPGYLKCLDETEIDPENERPLTIYDGSDGQSDNEAVGTSILQPDAHTISLQKHLNLVQKRRKLPKFQSVTYPGLKLYTEYDTNVVTYDQDQVQPLWNRQCPEYAYYDTNVLQTYATANQSTLGATPAATETDQEEDMDMSD